ncbi:hypothetical protein SCUP234_02112 [Seiridium cupressi]
MASLLWPQEFGFFQYLRLKATVVLYRIMVIFLDPFMMRRERHLVSPEVRLERIKIPSRDSGRYISGDLYYPPGYSSSPPTPLLINWHGSAFIIPALGHDAVICSRIAREAGIVVLDADYRKAPEHPFPEPPQDVEDVLKWVTTQGRFDLQRIAVMGFSAGGCLALVAATAFRKKFAHLINMPLAISVYPTTDHTILAEDKKVPNPIKAIPTGGMRLMTDCYVPNKDMRKNPLASPMFADPADYPDMTAIITVEGDTLRPEAEALADVLEKNGRNVFRHNILGFWHGFDKCAKKGTVEWNKRDELIDMMLNLLRGAFKL